MKREKVCLAIVQSTKYNGCVSIRLHEPSAGEAGFAGSIKRALTAAGYKPGDVVELVLVPYLKEA
jgi:hypothetical protein